MEFINPYGFQLKYKTSERRLPLLSQNRENEISTSNSKFGVENLKREPICINLNPYGFQLKYKTSERRLTLLSQNRENEISASNSKFGVENLKREEVKAVRYKNWINAKIMESENPYGFQLKYKTSE